MLGPVSFIIAALIVYWSGWATVSWLLGLQILMFGIYLLCRRLVPTDHLSIAQQVRSSAWLIGFYAITILLSWLGSFGGIGLISHPFDTLVVAVCALAVYYWGAAGRAQPPGAPGRRRGGKRNRAGRDPSSGGCRSRGFRVLSGAGRGWNDETSTVIDSHTGGEPTRLIIDGFPVLAGGTMAEKRDVLREQYDQWRRACLLEPRGNDVLVGALCCEPVSQDAVCGVIFFNNAGYLGMCGHGTIGLVASLRHLGRIAPGEHRIDTPVGQVSATLHEDGRSPLPTWPRTAIASRLRWTCRDMAGSPAMSPGAATGSSWCPGMARTCGWAMWSG